MNTTNEEEEEGKKWMERRVRKTLDKSDGEKDTDTRDETDQLVMTKKKKKTQNRREQNRAKCNGHENDKLKKRVKNESAEMLSLF